MVAGTPWLRRPSTTRRARFSSMTGDNARPHGLVPAGPRSYVGLRSRADAELLQALLDGLQHALARLVSLLEGEDLAQVLHVLAVGDVADHAVAAEPVEGGERLGALVD